ncbi:hypothetical protein R3P38DRAFT_3375069 [Favolaschia claudopus]|uniref:Uncharacterized protein n=1 Tax=Favolaschia claudopus TaxID=2862362 RepID=A0AAV9ZJP7_9AGAR
MWRAGADNWLGFEGQTQRREWRRRQADSNEVEEGKRERMTWRKVVPLYIAVVRSFQTIRPTFDWAYERSEGFHGRSINHYLQSPSHYRTRSEFVTVDTKHHFLKNHSTQPCMAGVVVIDNATRGYVQVVSLSTSTRGGPGIKKQYKSLSRLTGIRAFEAFKRSYKAGKSEGKYGATSSGTADLLPSPEIEETTPPDGKGKGKDTKTKKRKRTDSDVQIVDKPKPSPDESFNALRKKAAAPPPQKIPKLAQHVDEKVLKTEDVKRVKALPAKCQVTNVELQDDTAHEVYKGLPPLLYVTHTIPVCITFRVDSWFQVSAGMFIAWSSREGPGMFMISEFATTTPRVDFDTLWSCFVFVDKGKYVNLARANPLDFKATSQIYSTTKRRKAQNVPVLKFITGVHLSQDYDRIVGNVCTVFDHPELHAQLHEDAITFGTKSTTLEKLRKPQSSSSGGVRSSATKYKSSTYTPNTDTLSWDDEIVVYDARHTAFKAERDIDNLDRLLPRYRGEIPNGSSALVAYTVSQYRRKDSDEEHISFNLRFAVLLAERL